MRVESTVYQNPDHYTNQGTKPRLRDADGKSGYDRFARGGADELNPETTATEQREAEQKEARSLSGYNLAENAEESLLQRIKKAIDEMNRSAEINFVSLRFELHEESNRWMVQVIDIMENEVLRVIPPEELLELAGQIQRMTGVLLDTRR